MTATDLIRALSRLSPAQRELPIVVEHEAVCFDAINAALTCVEDGMEQDEGEVNAIVICAA